VAEYDRRVSVIRRGWRPGVDRNRRAASRNALRQLRAAGERRAQTSAAARRLEGSLISLAALIGAEVKDDAGRTVGRLSDVVVRWTNAAPYPVATAIIVRSGKVDVTIDGRWVEASAPASVRLRSSSAYARAPELHPGDVALAHDVLDRQLVDSSGVQMLRPSDVYLAAVDDRIELIGIEVGVSALLRRLGPKRLRGRIRRERVIDWALVHSFSPARSAELPSRGRRPELAGTVGSGLELDTSASEIHPLRADEVEAALEEGRREQDGE
jgi:hypothetical protein